MGQNNQESRLKYWPTRSSVRLFAATAHSFPDCSLRSRPPLRSLTSLTPKLVEKWMIRWLFNLFFFLFWPIVHCTIQPLTYLSVVKQELQSLSSIVEMASNRIAEMLEKSKETQSGVKLEVNENILESCTSMSRDVLAHWVV